MNLDRINEIEMTGNDHSVFWTIRDKDTIGLVIRPTPAHGMEAGSKIRHMPPDAKTEPGDHVVWFHKAGSAFAVAATCLAVFRRLGGTIAVDQARAEAAEARVKELEALGKVVYDAMHEYCGNTETFVPLCEAVDSLHESIDPTWRKAVKL